MIQINLLPGAEKRERGASLPGLPFKLPESMPEMDRMAWFIAAAWVIGPLLGLWLFLGVRGDMSDVQVALDQALADSARYGAVIQTQTRLKARQDTIAEKLNIIQEIDAGRYIWPHILDEVSRALPPFTWIEAVDAVDGSSGVPSFQIQGRTASLPALTRFMDALEASPFLRSIQLVSSEQAEMGGDPANIVNNFGLIGQYQVPSMDVIETVPLFDSTSDTAAEEASDGTGTS